ncbi:MAG: hypothetical protein IPJ86_10925 [Bacteroidetes bacterium]|nr:hypothetical protein [Bacteroidota bacterium]
MVSLDNFREHCLPTFGYRLPASGYQLPATSFRLPASGYRFPGVRLVSCFAPRTSVRDGELRLQPRALPPHFRLPATDSGA